LVNDTTVLDPVLLDLLVEWEERKAVGEPITPEELCRACPERIEDFLRQVKQIARIDPLLALAGEGVPASVPGFELYDEIGRGGMGVVYKARDIGLDRVVALKIPFRAANGKVPRKRFEREVQALAKLRHPNIVSVYSAGLTGVTPYLVMEYVPGGSLAERMNEVAETPARAAALVAKVARAVGHAHDAGIVHRDLKPSNILLDDQGQPLVSDFGVAALLAGESVSGSSEDTPDDRRTVQTRLTRTGAAAGTPAYSAPEQVGGPRRVSATADVWSLGVVLYECLTGRLPYPTEAAGDIHRTLPPRPSSIRPEVPRRLEAIALRCLVFEPTGRYPTAAAVARDLESWSSRVRFRRRLKAGGLYGLIGLALFSLMGLMAWPKSPEKRHAVESRELVSALDRVGRLDLVPSAGLPKTHLVRVNQSLAQTGVSAENYFFAECPRPCLVELLPDVPYDRYLFTAELRQMTGLQDAEVGLYCGHVEVTDPPDSGHRFVILSFADVGLLAYKYPGPKGQAGSALNLQGFRYRPPDPPAGAWELGAIRWAWYPPPAVKNQMPGPWRQVSLEVSPDILLGKSDAVALTPGPARLVANSVLSPRYPRGALGVYVNSCQVQVRNCRIERFPSP